MSKLITVVHKKKLYRILVNGSVTFYFITQVNAAAAKSGYIPRYCFTLRRYRVYREQSYARMKKENPLAGYSYSLTFPTKLVLHLHCSRFRKSPSEILKF